MDRTALHLEVRNALELADELSRFVHTAGNDTVAGNMRALLASLEELERQIGRKHDVAIMPDSQIVHAVHRSLDVLCDRRDEIDGDLRGRFAQLEAAGRRVCFALERPGEPVPSKALLGVLPVKRIVPQDAHTVIDWLASAACGASAIVARTSTARVAGATLAMAGTGTSMVTDYRLSPVRILPIEVHESIDYAWGASVALAPFVLGYAKRDPIATIIQVAAGIGTILVSLFTDYRAVKGITWPKRSHGGPEAQARHKKGQRVSGEVQRPLEGFSSAPTGWDA
jgi:hypothetical protein